MEDKATLAVAMAVLLVVIVRLKSFLVPGRKLKLPPGPWTLPVIGNIHHLGTSPLIYRTLNRLSQKHGPLMSFRIGEIQAVVVSSPEAAQAVLKTHDVSFADRFTNPTFSTLTYDGADLAFAPYGERWRQLRKICVLEMLSVARVESFRRIREDEVSRFMRNVAACAAGGTAMDMTEGISRFINDAFVRECVGSRCKYQDDYLNALHDTIRLTTGLNLADIFPSSNIMQLLSSASRQARGCRERMQRVVEQIIQECKEAMERGEKVGNESILGILVRLQNEGGTDVQLSNDTIVALMFDLFGAGSDTSSTVLNWCMAELIRSPKVMAKVQAEVREIFKGKNVLTEGDIAGTEFSYLKLVIKEAMRLHIPVPLLIPRRTRETCRIMGYDVPKGTAIFVNAWAICRDPMYWDDPEEFKPERFKNSNLDYKGTNFEFLPFGAGRRMCPGINLGLANIELALASLLYHFDWKLPNGMEPKDIDMGEAAGLIGSKKTSLVLLPITRVAPASM